MQNVKICVTGQVYTFSQLLAIIAAPVQGVPDSTAPATYQWAAQVLGGTLDQCSSMEEELAFGLLEFVPSTPHISPCGQWQLDLLQVPDFTVGRLRFIGPELTVSPAGLVWLGEVNTLLDFMPSTYS